jgi:hypothetical protein
MPRYRPAVPPGTWDEGYPEVVEVLFGTRERRYPVTVTNGYQDGRPFARWHGTEQLSGESLSTVYKHPQSRFAKQNILRIESIDDWKPELLQAGIHQVEFSPKVKVQE